MFEALRWRLTAWYVLAFAVVFIVIGLIVFGWVHHRLMVNVDDAIRQVSDNARVAVTVQQTPADSEESVRDVLAKASLSGSADVFVLLLAPDGRLAANPSDVPTAGLPAEGAVDRARDRGEDWRSISIDGQPVQLRTIAVHAVDGHLLGFVQAGKSVEASDASLRTLALVMAAGGIAGLVLATVGGLFVAGIAIRPVRLGFERQREFVADASHELRTPLAVIRTNAETIAAARPADEAAGDIAAEATYMTRLLDDLLVLARSDHGGIGIDRTRFDLARAVLSVGRVAQTIAGSAGLRLDTDVRGELWIDGDPERCKELMLILLDNAVKYTPTGGRIRLTASADGGDVVIRVSDTGIGVAPEHIPRLFDRFYRVDKARSRAVGGAGLGLSIAREIVDAHAGVIAIESTPGSGSAVTVRIPRVPGSVVA